MASVTTRGYWSMARGELKDEVEARDDTRLVTMTAGIVSAYLSRNQVLMADVPAAIRGVYQALAALASGAAGEPGGSTAAPAVSVKKSVTDEYLICLEDGKRLKMLKRYLRTHHNMTPEQYRTKWGLPHDYPMVAPAYARTRSAFAKKIGLGKIPTGATRGRKRKAS